GLGKTVGLFQEVCQMASDGLGSRAQRDDPLKVLRVIFLIGNLATIAIEIALARPPTGRIPSRDDSVDTVRRQEPIVNALAEAVSVEWIAEVGIGVTVVFAKRRGRHS